MSQMKTKTKRIIGAIIVLTLVALPTTAALSTSKHEGGYTCLQNGKRSIALIVKDDSFSVMSANRVSDGRAVGRRWNTYTLANGSYVYWNGERFGIGKTKKNAKSDMLSCRKTTLEDMRWIEAGAH